MTIWSDQSCSHPNIIQRLACPLSLSQPQLQHYPTTQETGKGPTFSRSHLSLSLHIEKHKEVPHSLPLILPSLPSLTLCYPMQRILHCLHPHRRWPASLSPPWHRQHHRLHPQRMLQHTQQHVAGVLLGGRKGGGGGRWGTSKEGRRGVREGGGGRGGSRWEE